jgi:hypothetical protein
MDCARDRQRVLFPPGTHATCSALVLLIHAFCLADLATSHSSWSLNGEGKYSEAPLSTTLNRPFFFAGEGRVGITRGEGLFHSRLINQ